MARDIQDALDQEYSISITYLPNNQTVSFSGYISDLNDTFKQDWTPESVYGRMDPIYAFKNTTRKITCNIDVPSDSDGDAIANFMKLEKLITFNYPVYVKQNTIKLVNNEQLAETLKSNNTKLVGGNAMLISQPPLVAIKFANIISSNNVGGKLIGKLNGTNYEWDKDATFFANNGRLIPRYFKIKLEFDVMHGSPLGWEQDGANISIRDKKGKFPYGV